MASPDEPITVEWTPIEGSNFCDADFVVLEPEQWRLCVERSRPDCAAEETPQRRRRLLARGDGLPLGGAQDAARDGSSLLSQAPHEWYDRKRRQWMPKPRPDADDDAWPGASEYSTGAAHGRDPALQGLFAGALGGMVGVPGVGKAQVFYLAPAPEQPPGFPAGRKWPQVFETGVVYCLTAWNPMGIDAAPERNERANKLLYVDLGNLREPRPRALWHGFGFTGAGTWREEGFWVAYKFKDEKAGEAQILGLASKYQQAAIYVHRATSGRLARRVLWTGLDPEGEGEQSREIVYMRQVPPPRGPQSGRLWLGSGTWEKDKEWEVEEGEEGEFDIIRPIDDDFDATASTKGAGVTAFSAWHDEWQRRFECWWLGLPVSGQRQYGACLGALGLHLGGRLDRAWHATQALMGSPQPFHGAHGAVGSVAEPGCEWVEERNYFELPEFPEFPTMHPDFRLPAIPSLVPGWKRLHSLDAMGLQLHAGRPPSFVKLDEPMQRSKQWTLAAAAGAGAGAGAAVSVGLLLAVCHRAGHVSVVGRGRRG